jgi:uncharacterized protein (TIGR02611 family)
MKMFEEIRRSWRLLESGKPGARFERYYLRHQGGRSPVRKVASVVIGLVIIAAGIILLPAPGPGTLVVALGTAFLAGESLRVARGLDWLEPRLRKALAAAKRRWEKSSPAARAAFVLVAAVIVVGAALGGYELMFGD